VNLSIETSSRHGSVTLADGDAVIQTAALEQHRRHNVELMPTIDALCRSHGMAPADIAELYVSLGPGSFTGLRVGVTTAKTLAFTTGCRVVGVPSLDVIACNAPPDIHRVAVCANLKRNTVYAAIYELDVQSTAGPDKARHGRAAHPAAPPKLQTLQDLLQADPPPDAILGDPLPDLPPGCNVAVLPAELAVPRSEAVHRLGRDAAKRAAYDDPFLLTPLYIRRPEAVELWEARQQSS